MEGAKVRGELGCVKGKMLGVREMMQMGHAVEQVWLFLLMCFMAPGGFSNANQPQPITVNNIGQLLSSDLLAPKVRLKDLLVIIRDLTQSEAQLSKWASRF